MSKPRYEYKVVFGGYDYFPEITLNELAQLGWELVTVSAATPHGGGSHIYGYFRREVQPTVATATSVQ